MGETASPLRNRADHDTLLPCCESLWENWHNTPPLRSNKDMADGPDLSREMSIFCTLYTIFRHLTLWLVIFIAFFYRPPQPHHIVCRFNNLFL